MDNNTIRLDSMPKILPARRPDEEAEGQPRVLLELRQDPRDSGRGGGERGGEAGVFEVAGGGEGDEVGIGTGVFGGGGEVRGAKGFARVLEMGAASEDTAGENKHYLGLGT